MDSTDDGVDKARKRSKGRFRFRWTEVTSSPDDIQLQSYNPVIVGHLVYVYGSYISRFQGGVLNLSDSSWEVLYLRFKSQIKHVSVLVEDKVYTFGGQYAQGEPVRELIVHDLALHTTREVKGLDWPGIRASLTAVWVPWRREIVFFGGTSAPHYYDLHNDTFAFNVDRESWQKLETRGVSPERRRNHSVVLVDKNMFVYGGRGSRNALRDICVADVSLTFPSWSTVLVRGKRPGSRDFPAFEYFAGVLVLYGGQGPGGDIDTPRDLTLFSLQSAMWTNVKDSRAEVEGEVPYMSHARAVSRHDGLLVFTTGSVFKLEIS